ncbi:hypothetical protein FGIG_01642 [Fasciola gigantica]|uniref:Uncharacterized protein n=1 Tax=Fasciola gigantica TaxID=46835 RepID=A0A504Z272_FASGI|nr:hypothetical protein FGIG_01642 [Fasciola gigantica]
MLLGMTYAKPAHHPYRDAPGVIQVLPEPIYCLPTDNLTVSFIETTNRGRIFLGTREGFLLEMNYGPIPGCTSNSSLPLPTGSYGPCNLINHSSSALAILLPSVLTSGFRSSDSICQIASDPVRGLLYTRTGGSALSVYTFCDKSTSISRLATQSSSDIAYTASAAVRSVDKGQFRSIVSIHPLTTGLCYLMAVTKTGIRLYFGENLRLLHIRLPPTSPHGTIGLDEVKLVAESRGTSVLLSALPHRSNPSFSSPASPWAASNLSTVNPSLPGSFTPISNGTQQLPPGSGDQYDVPPHVLYTISPDPYPWTPNLAEVCTTAWCTGGAWALVVLPSRDTLASGLNRTSTEEAESKGSKQSVEDAPFRRGPPPVVLTQHLDPPCRRLVLISAQGIVHLRLPSPMTRLREFLTRELSTVPRLDLDDTPAGQSIWSSLRLNKSHPFLSLDDSSAACELSLNTGFLTAYLHQFSPDEAICAAMAIGAIHFTAGGDCNTRDLGLAVEQAILYFAAEAAQFWIPSVRRSASGASRGPLGTLPCAAAEDIPVDKSLATGLFLFSGLCVFLARVGRTFWRTPLFRDATAVLGISDSTGTGPGVLTSWMRRFVHTLATASPLGFGGQNKMPPEQPIISRLDPEEISWLIQQITYVQQFLRRQLDVRGGWFRANQSNPLVVHRATPLRMGSGDGVEHLDAVLLQRLAEELDQLLSLVLELLGLWRILSEHVVHKVVRGLTPDQRRSILHVPFEAYSTNLLDLVSPTRALSPNVSPSPPSSPTASPTLSKTPVLCGVDLITTLINALIEYYLTEASQDMDSGINLDGITGRLQAVCPTLFANEDAISAKASECLIQASLLRTSYLVNSPSQPDDLTTVTSDESVLAQIDQLVQQALNLYAEAGPSLDLDNAVQRLEAAGAWRGAIALCLTVALKRDPTNVAVDCLKHGRRPSSEPPLTGSQSQMGRQRRLSPRRVRCGALHNPVTELAATEGRYDAYHRLINCLERLYQWSRIAPRSTTLSSSKSSQPASPEQSLLQSDTSISPSKVATYLTQPDASPTTARSVLHTALRDIVKCEDILAHFEVIGWLLSHGLTETVIALDSPHFEAYLRSRLRQTPDDPDLRCLLWRQLERRGARLEAAQVLEHLAVTPCRQLTLDDRLDFAARAVVAVKALPPAQQDLEYLRELEARLELAQLQQQLCVELSQLGQDTSRSTRLSSPALTRTPSTPGVATAGAARAVDDAIAQLSHGPLLSLTEMFTNFANPFGLHESKLCLLWTSGSTDELLIKAIWRDLLRQVLSRSKTGPDLGTSFDGMSPRSPIYRRHSPITVAPSQSPDPQSRQLIELALVDCLTRLGQRFAADSSGFGSTRAQTFFPLVEIVSCLEYFAIQKKFPAHWVPTILRDTRLPAGSHFVDAYDQLLHSKDSAWRRPEVRTRLFTAMVTVIEDFLSSGVLQLGMRPRMLQVGRILDRVTGNLVDLNADSLDKKTTTTGGTKLIDGEDDHQAQVISRLRRVHDQLQRFYR